MNSYLFGPVPSRRLGRSLGIDLVPCKTCTYDCIYCQLGRTTCKTLERKEWAPLNDILKELENKLSCRPDYITLGGSGEPTLFSRTGELIDCIKSMTDCPVAVLTNGSLLWQEEIRMQLMDADLVLPSLDAGDEQKYQIVNRPHEDISFEKMLNGLIDLRNEFQGQYWLEVFLLKGYTDDEVELAKLAKCANLIKPDRIQLNTVSRPPAECCAVGISREEMANLATMFEPQGEIIANFPDALVTKELSAGLTDVLEMLKRRPCSIEDIANGLSMHRAEAIKYIEILTAKDAVKKDMISGIAYYRVKPVTNSDADNYARNL